MYDDCTIGEIEIANDDVVEMVSLGNNKLATRNEGFLFAFWSIVPFIISASFICGGLVGRFDMLIRGAYFLVGSIIGVPAVVFMVLGFTESFPKVSRTSIVGGYWFSNYCSCCECNCSCNKCEKKEEDSEADLLKDDVLI